MINPKRARRLIRLSHVQRWAAIPTLQSQSVAEHSYNVVCIALWLTQFHRRGREADFRGKVVMGALIHDEGEALSGDIDATYKTRSRLGSVVKDFESQNGIGQVDESVRVLVKLADKLEALLFVDTELAMGNHRLREIRIELLQKVRDSWTKQFEHKDEFGDKINVETEFLRAFDPMIHPAMEGV